jgi:hypothetical protein
MSEWIIPAIVTGVAGLGYIFRLERQLSLQDQAITALKEILNIHLANIDGRLQRIEKRLNGYHDAHDAD